MIPPAHLATGYSDTYAAFDSHLMRTIRREAYGEDIGQHSWISGDELRSHIKSLTLSNGKGVLDFGCGPGGPATFIAREVDCKVTGVDLSAAALRVATARAQEMGVSSRTSFMEADGNQQLPLTGPFDAIVMFDVILHLRDREAVIKRLSPMLTPGGKLLITDAGVLTGHISNEEVAGRSVNGFTQFVPPGYNERILESCGFSILSVEDRTQGVVDNASGRLKARNNHYHQLVEIEGEDKFQQQQRYLETVVSLSERRALSRQVYLAEVGARLR